MGVECEKSVGMVAIIMPAFMEMSITFPPIHPWPPLGVVGGAKEAERMLGRYLLVAELLSMEETSREPECCLPREQSLKPLWEGWGEGGLQKRQQTMRQRIGSGVTLGMPPPPPSDPRPEEAHQ